MTFTLTFIFLTLFILAIIHWKTAYKIPYKNYIKWPPHLSSLANITVYLIWTIGCLLMLMEVLLICDVYTISSFPWTLFELPLITSVTLLLFISMGIKNRILHDKEKVLKHLRVIVKVLFLQVTCVSFTSIVFVIKFYFQNN